MKTPLQLKPAEARGKFKPELMNDDSYWMEEKFDGCRYLMHLGVVGKKAKILTYAYRGARNLDKNDSYNRFTSRKISVKNDLYVEKTDNFPHLHELDMPVDIRGTVVDGEITAQGVAPKDRDITPVTGAKPEKAIAHQEEHGYAVYKIFDVLYFNGKDVRDEPLHVRRKYAKVVVKTLVACNPEKKKYIKLSRVFKTGKQEQYEEMLSVGKEGGLLKHVDSKYGERTKWVKVIENETYDVVVMGYVKAKEMTTKSSGEVSVSKFHKKGWIGAIRFGQYKGKELIECGQCSGMTDAIRKYITNNKKKCIGNVFEMKAKERNENGKFRHPRFIKWRDDKGAKQCEYNIN